jgi:hypothetical protein
MDVSWFTDMRGYTQPTSTTLAPNSREDLDNPVLQDTIPSTS